MMGIFFKLELFCHLNRKVSMKMNLSKKKYNSKHKRIIIYILKDRG